MKRQLPALAAAALVMALAATPALALECPVPHSKASAGVIKETPEQTEAYTSILAGGDTGNAVDTVIADIRHKYPDATKEEIINYLVTAYCPAVEAEGYGGAIATQKIREFSSLVTKRLYGQQ